MCQDKDEYHAVVKVGSVLEEDLKTLPVHMNNKRVLNTQGRAVEMALWVKRFVHKSQIPRTHVEVGCAQQLPVVPAPEQHRWVYSGQEVG